jgi:antitoxin MazE
MKTKLTRIGDDIALVLDRPLLDELGLDESSEIEVSTNGDVLVMTPLREPGRRLKLNKILDELDEDYAGVFRRLAE